LKQQESKMVESESARLIIENLPKVSHDELKIINDEVAKERQKRIGSIRKEATKLIRQMALDAGLLVDIKLGDETPSKPVVSTTDKPKKEVSIKYQDPDNKANSWSGRGIRPKWLKEKLTAGSNIEDFLVGAD